MSDSILQIQIINKEGKVVVVPLKIWENGLKTDPDWKVYVPPKPKAQPVTPVAVVEIKKPVPPAAPPVVTKVKAGRPKGKRKR